MLQEIKVYFMLKLNHRYFTVCKSKTLYPRDEIVKWADTNSL